MPVSVSIIIPVYNAEQTLPRCVRSLLEQTCRSLEILLIDDGSTDDSPALCDKLAAGDRRVRTVHIANGGPAAARNAGLDRAQGEFVGFADADDWVEPGMFASLLEQAKTSEADLAVCDYWADQPGSSAVCKPFSGDSRIFSTENIRAHVLPYFFGYAPGELASFAEHCPFADSRSYVWCCLYRAALLQKSHIRFPDEKRYYTEDNLFNLSVVACAARIAYLARPLYHYIEQASTFTGRFQSAYFDCRLHKYAYLQTFAAEHDLDAILPKRLIRKICAELPTLLNYYAINAPTFEQKVKAVRRILREPCVMQALREVPSTEWPGGRLGTTLALAKRKQALPIVFACLAQKILRAGKR